MLNDGEVFDKMLRDLVCGVVYYSILVGIYDHVDNNSYCESGACYLQGLHGKIFTCYKFRSMRVDSGKVRLTTLLNDDRVFPFGKFIRATKIDEMPQAFNILFGDMSIVGPRPEDEANAANYYVGEYKHILDVKPGLTSPASLYDYTHGEKYEDSDLYEKEFIPQKLKLELYYVDHKSFLYDNYLIMKTSWLILLTILGKKNFEVPKELEAKNIT